MIIRFHENDYNSWFDIEPETPQETAQLYRMVRNSKAQKPEMYMSFGADEKSKIWCTVTIKKLSKESNKVSNSIKNY